jgi:hypothetical protein
MADKKSQGRKNAKDLASGKAKPSSVGAKARAAANKLKSTSSSKPKAELYSGKHRAAGKADTGPGSYEFGGKHSKGAATGKHAAPATKASVAKNMTTQSSAASTGKHSKENIVSKMKAGMAERKAARAKVGRK